MIKKTISLLIVIFFAIHPILKADEGMWLPFMIERLNYVDMQKEGLQLTPEEIYAVNHSSLKDAVIIFGRGCTGEIVSDKGLILTNHHCGYSYIQKHSSVEADYLTDGFWARSFDEELPNPGLTAKFLIRIEDVSERVNSQLSDTLNSMQRSQKIREISTEIEQEATKDTYYDASVKSFFKGNEFYLFVYATYKDVRMVGAPPSSIGNFGGDTDNWMWPRHTGDFSVFRVYSAPDGSPAEYSEENVPFKPAHHFEISLDGVEEGDFAMIMGYPGSTQRYLTSDGVKQAINIKNPTIVEVRDQKLKIMKKAMDASDEVRIKYASKYARVANYWKYFQGQTRGLKRLKVAKKKAQQEKAFTEWINQDEARLTKYGDALQNISQGYKMQEPTLKAQIYFAEAVMGTEIFGFALRHFYRLNEMMQNDADQKEIDDRMAKIKESLDDYFKDYDANLDKNMLAGMLEMYYYNISPVFHPTLLTEYYSEFGGNFQELAAYIFEESMFDNKAEIMAFLSKPKARTLKEDKALELITTFYQKYQEMAAGSGASEAYLSKGYRLYVAGLREMNPDKKYYPDANFTMRLTYGTVGGYQAADAVEYLYYTTLDGVMEKEDPNDEEFIVPAKLKELYETKDYGRYAYHGQMRTCFLSNLDITGGNSGSPVLNGKGQLIGIAFDGNWEAMSGDIAFEPELQRTISVDIRYVLFIIDKFAGATRLIDEMDLVQLRPKPAQEILPHSKTIKETIVD